MKKEYRKLYISLLFINLSLFIFSNFDYSHYSLIRYYISYQLFDLMTIILSNVIMCLVSYNFIFFLQDIIELAVIRMKIKNIHLVYYKRIIHFCLISIIINILCDLIFHNEISILSYIPEIIAVSLTNFLFVKYSIFKFSIMSYITCFMFIKFLIMIMIV